MGSISPFDSTAAIAPETLRLFKNLENNFKTSGLGVERWYLVAITALSGGPKPQMASELYQYLISQPQFSTPNCRQALIRRLREALVKGIAIFGVCKPIESILAISQIERDEDKDYTCSRENWSCDEANLESGESWMRKIYRHDMQGVLDLFKAHKDFAWISTNISYGLYLSDRQILDDIDCQVVVLTGIMVQNLKLETHWHIRGARRLGVSKADLTMLWNGVQTIATSLGLTLDRVSTIDDVQDV